MKVEELEFVSDMVSQQVLAVAEELFSEIADLRSLFSGHQMSLTEMALEHTDPKTGKITYRRGTKIPQGANPKNWRVIANPSQGGGGGGGGDAAPAAKQPHASKGAAAGGGAAPDASGGGKKAKGGGGGAGGGKQPAGGAAAGQGPAPGAPEPNVPAPEAKQKLDAHAQQVGETGSFTKKIKTPDGAAAVIAYDKDGTINPEKSAVVPGAFNFEPMEEGMEPLPPAEGQEQGAKPAAGNAPAAQTPPAVQPEFDSSHIVHPEMKKAYEGFVGRTNKNGGSSKLVSKAPNGNLTFVGLDKNNGRTGESIEVAEHHLSPEGKKIQPPKTTPPVQTKTQTPAAGQPATTPQTSGQGAAQPPVKPPAAPTGGRNAKLDKTPPPPRSASASIATAAKVQKDQGTTSPQATPGTQVPTPQTPGKAVRPGGVSPEFDPNQPAERRNPEFNKVLAQQDQGTTSPQATPGTQVPQPAAAKGSFDVDLETGQKTSSEDTPAQADPVVAAQQNKSRVSDSEGELIPANWQPKPAAQAATPPSPAPATAPPAQSSAPQAPTATPPQQQDESQEPDQPRTNYLTGQPMKSAPTPQSKANEVETDVFNANFNKYMKQGMPADKAMQAAGRDALKAKQQAQQAPAPPQPAAQAQPAPVSGQTAPNQGANKAQTAPAHQPQTPPPAAPQAAQPQQPADNSGNAPLPAQPVSIKNWEGTKAPKSKPVKLPDHVGAEATKQIQDIVDHFNNNPSLGKTARIVNDAKGTHLEVFDTNTGKVDPKFDVLIHGHGAGLTDFSGKKYTPDPAMSKPVGPSATAGDISDNDVQSLHGRLKAGERVNKGAPHEVAASLAHSRGYTEPGHVKEAMAIADRISKEAKSQSQFENQLRSEIDARFPKIEKDKQVVWPGKPHGVQLSDHLQNTAVENLRRLGYNDPKTLSAFKSSVAKFMKANPGVGIGQATASLNKYMEKAFPRKEQIADVLPGKQEDIAVPTAKNVAAPADQTGVPTAQAVGLPQAKMAPAGAKAQDQAIRDRRPGAAQPASQAQASAQAGQPVDKAASAPPTKSSFLSPTEHREKEFRDKGYTDDQIAHLKEEGVIGATDPLTGYLSGAKVRSKTIDRAIEHAAQSGEEGAYADIDLANLGGLNKNMGSHSAADKVFRQMSDIIKREVEKAGGSISLHRIGDTGDEMNVVGMGISKDKLNDALGRAQRMIQEYVDTVKTKDGTPLKDITHAKQGMEHYRGTGIHFGVSDIGPGMTHKDVIKNAETQTEKNKLQPVHGRSNVERRETEEAGAGAPGERPRGPDRRTRQADQGVGEGVPGEAPTVDTGPGTSGPESTRQPSPAAPSPVPQATSSGPSEQAHDLAKHYDNNGAGPKHLPAQRRDGREGAIFDRAWSEKLAELAHLRGHTAPEDMHKALESAKEVLRTGKTGKELMHAMNEKLARDFPIKEDRKKAAVDAAKKNQNVFKSTLVPLSKDPARMPAAFKKFIHKNAAGNYVVRHTGGHTEFSNVQDMVKWVNQKHAESHARENKANKRANKPLIDLNRSEHWLDNKAAREMSLSQDWPLEIDTLGALAAPFLMSLKSEKHDFGCALFKLPSHIAEAVKAYGDCIPKEYLAGNGREEKPHITLLYGLHDENAVRLASVVNGWGPVKVRLGQITLFQCPEYDVLKFEVDGSDLRALNNHVRGLMEHTSSWEVYRPHVTIAYLKHGCGYDYTGLSKLTGQEFELPLLTYCSPDGQESLIPLGNISPEMLAVMATMDSYLSMSLGGEEEAEVVKPMSRRLSGFDTPVEMAVAHAPAGGAWVAGEFFKGGEFIPKWVVDKATDEEKDKLHGPTQEPLSERDKLIRHLTEKTIKALEGDANSLLSEQAQQYLEASKAVFAEMSTPQLRRTAHNLTTVRFFPSPKALTQELNNIMGPDRTRKVVGGAWLQDEGAGTGDLLLDGDLSGAENVAISDIYAHEYGHVFDGDKSGKLTSESSAWKAAWKQEIAGGQLDKYAKTDSYEGFAEYARLYLTKPDVAQKKFPQCWTVWQESGLVE